MVQSERLLSLWGKTKPDGPPHSVLGHLLDAAAVAELIWDSFLTDAARAKVDSCCGGRGRDVLVLLAGWHDLGKATPAFQVKDRQLAAIPESLGLTLPVASVRRLRHGESGSMIAQRVLVAARVEGAEWLLPIISGHHGSFLSSLGRDYRSEWQEGRADVSALWRKTQEEMAAQVLAEMTIDLSSLHLDLPPLAVQLAIAGWVSMADWIASSDLFPGMGRDPVTAAEARARATRAWSRLGLGRSPAARTAASFAGRFGFSPSPLQELVIERAQSIGEPGIMVIEAPMGAGKTEAAFAAVEVLAARFGSDGFVFAMPTQGTSDAMFERCLKWAHRMDPDYPVSLLHGKAMANETWRALTSPVTLSEVYDPELDDAYGLQPSTTARSAAGVPSEWLVGRHRGLLSQGVVGTVDQPLMAATHIKYVALRFAGLIGKVVVIDEVHSYDVFMSSYLRQFLSWCGDGGIPVILMSATLPPSQRRELLEAYAAGLGPTSTGEEVAAGYPSVTTWTPSAGVDARSAPHSRPDVEVAVTTATIDVDDTSALADLVAAETASGGVALVILNTVRRAQETYRRLRDGAVPAVLLHSRLTTGARAKRTQDLVARLGPRSDRPRRLVVVATQVAEQSFDVDADLLITDVAPMDLLLQRIGRLHRHPRPETDRGAHARPRVVITGLRPREDRAPVAPVAFDYVYDRYSLLRTAQLIAGPDVRFQIPSQVPDLVSRAYDESLSWPDAWREEGMEAWQQAEARRDDQSIRAGTGLLHPNPDRADTLQGLHGMGVERSIEHISVRDAEPSREVAVVRWDQAHEEYRTLAGRPLGSTGERVSIDSIAREVLADTVRVRHREPLGDLEPLPGWRGVPLVWELPALVLRDGNRTLPEAWGWAEYDEETGLTIVRTDYR